MSQSAAQRAREILESNPLFFDTETTGLGSADEIVEVGIVDAQGNTLLDSLVRPVSRIPHEVIGVHGITNEMVRGAPTWERIWPEVQALFDGRTVGIFNADFDLRMMRQSHERHGLEWQPMGGNAFCVMKLYARFYGERLGIRNARWQGLQKAGRQCGISSRNAHRAVDDARLASQVFRHMAESGQTG